MPRKGQANRLPFGLNLPKPRPRIGATCPDTLPATGPPCDPVAFFIRVSQPAADAGIAPGATVKGADMRYTQ